jgi:hypothetical protein
VSDEAAIELPVQAVVAVEEPALVEPLDGPLPQPLAERLSLTGAPTELAEKRCCERRRVLRLGEQRAVVERLGHPADVGRHHRPAAHHRLDHRVGEPLGHRAQHDDVGPGEGR